MKRLFIETLNELQAFSAGQCVGMRNFAMALAADKTRPVYERDQFVKEARKFHWQYISKKRVAREMREPVEVKPAVLFALPEVEAGWFTRKQAGGVS